MVWYSMVWYGMVWYGIVWYCMVKYGMVWYHMVCYGTNSMVSYCIGRYGMVWYGMVWYGMEWYGMELYGKVWYGMVSYGKSALEYWVARMCQFVSAWKCWECRTVLKSTDVLECASRRLEVLEGVGSVRKRMWCIDI